MEEDISPDLIQVKATMKEIKERIEQFIQYKRAQSNANNVLDFCGAPSQSQCCARVDAVLVRKKDSSSHMAVRNVLDRYTTKYSTEKNSPKQKPLSTNDRGLKLHSLPQSLSQPICHNKSQQDVASVQRGEKRTFDVAALEVMLDMESKQTKTEH